MKKFLLSLGISVVSVLPSAAQWQQDASVNNLVSPPGQSNYGWEIQTTAEGLSYMYIHIPDNNYPSKRIQVIDKDGYLLLGDDAKELCAEYNLTYTKIGQCLMIDNEGNAIVAACDFRTGEETYTIYKVNSKGEELWHTTLNGGVSLGYIIAGMSMVTTADGGYVFAYLAYDEFNGADRCSVSVEKLNSDGTSAWDEPLLLRDPDGKTDYSYPYLVDAGSSQTMLVYAKGATPDLMARLIDFDGTSVWDEDVAVWQGGFTTSNNPVHTMMDVMPGPDGGALVSWMNIDPSTGGYENRLSYITNDGLYGFSTGDLGTNVSNDTDNSRQYPRTYCVEEDGQTYIYCLWRQFNQEYQNWQGLYMQKMTTDGELLWEANGKAIVDMQDDSQYLYYSIQGAGEGQFAVFYMKKDGMSSVGTVGSYMVIYDKDGNEVLPPTNFTTSETMKTGLTTSQLIDGRYFLASFEDYDTEEVYMQRVFLDGSTTDGIDQAISGDQGKKLAYREIFAPDGQKRLALSRGINIVKEVYSDGSSATTKQVVK